jgi:FkbM family methyltransferase
MPRLAKLRQAVNARLHASGWEVREHPAKEGPAYWRRVLLDRLGVDVVVDVGANVGQFGSELRLHGFTGHIFSVEPMQAAHDQLQAAAHADGNWSTMRTALGPQAGELTMNVSANSISSSALAMLDRHAEAAPHSRYVATERTPVTTLDAAAGERLARFERPFLKIDTQGFERPILESGPRTLERVVGVQLELALEPLYHGQETWQEHIAYMAERGLRFVGMYPIFWDSGEALAADGLFIRG